MIILKIKVRAKTFENLPPLFNLTKKLLKLIPIINKLLMPIIKQFLQ